MTHTAPVGHDDPSAPDNGRHELPPAPLLWRGVALGGLSLLLGRIAARSFRRSILLAPLALVCVTGAALAAWASAIQLTGGVRHDDHPWV